MTARLVRDDPSGLRVHWVRSIHTKVGGQAVEVVKVWRAEGGTARLVYERVTDVVVTPVWPSSVTLGSAFTVTGTATDVKGLPVNQGSAFAEVLKQGASAWERLGSGSPISNGQFSIPVAAPTYGGAVRYRVWVDVNPPLLDSASAEQAYTVALPTMARPTASALTHTSLTLAWTAVPGADGYQIGNNGSVIGTTAATSLPVTTAQATQYNFQVRVYEDTPSGRVYGPWSPILYFNGGRPEVRDSGAATVHVNCVGSGCHRNDTGWNNPYVRQGFFSSPYGGDGYVGIFDYGDWGVANAIINALGRSRYDNGSCTRAITRVYKRGDVGNTSCVPVNFYTGTSWVGGSRPGLYRYLTSPTLCYNTWTQIELGAAAGNDLARQVAGCRNIAIYANSSAQYAALNNHTAGSEDGDLWVDWSWNYVSQSYIAPRTWT